MKKISTKIITVALLATTVAPVLVSAKSNPIAIGSLKAKTFDSDPVVMLPGNPFYGLLGAVDIVKESVSNDKLTTRTNLLNRYAARLLKTYELNSKDERLVLRSLKDYQSSAYQYAMVVSKLDSAFEGSDSERSLSLTLLTHIRLIDEASEWKQFTNVHRAILSDINEKLTNSAVFALKGPLPISSFIERASRESSDKSITEQIRTAEILSIIAKACAKHEEDDLAKALLEKRAEILSDVSKIVTLENISDIKNSAGSSAERLQTVLFLLDSPELRNNQTLVDLKNLLLIRAF